MRSDGSSYLLSHVFNRGPARTCLQALARWIVGGFICSLRIWTHRSEIPGAAPEIRTVDTYINIEASKARVWPEIIRVRPITEEQTGLFYKMGFPKPVEATLSKEGWVVFVKPGLKGVLSFLKR